VSALVVRCPAKVNLHLRVLGRRPDGYHELRTLFVSVGLWDEVEVRGDPGGRLELVVEPAGSAPQGPDNLVLRAAASLRRLLPAPCGAAITLRKAIPTAAGLGGGSADAAAALVALARLWGLDHSFAALAPLAAELGADVPFFLLGAWRGRGRGDRLTATTTLPFVPGARARSGWPRPNSASPRARPSPAPGPAPAPPFRRFAAPRASRSRSRI
jgi:4-diphosphocytidyl-2-C-methyl-D-erythritol kinase